MNSKVLIHANSQPDSLQIVTELEDAIQSRQIDLVATAQQADYIISIGGDGTLLSTFHRYSGDLNKVQFIGIHTGHLGFYTDWVQEQLPELLDALENTVPDAISYPLLSVQLTFNDDTQAELLALNEFTMRSVSGTMVLKVSIKGDVFETFRGDGVCIATPTGSTGLNKSLGGAVMHPRINAIQMTEMASINNRVYRTLGSPLIIPDDEWIDLEPVQGDTGVISIDNKSWEDHDILRVRCRVAKERIQFASFKHTHFWSRVEYTFIGSQS